MTPLDWLRRRTVAGRPPTVPDGIGRLIEATTAAEDIGRLLGAPDAATIAANRTAAVQRFREVAAAGGTVADQLAAVRAMDVWANDPYRCGCYPRYTGGCYCTRRHQ